MLLGFTHFLAYKIKNEQNFRTEKFRPRNAIPFSAKKTKTKVTCADITEVSYGSVINITFSTQRK